MYVIEQATTDRDKDKDKDEDRDKDKNYNIDKDLDKDVTKFTFVQTALLQSAQSKFFCRVKKPKFSPHKMPEKKVVKEEN